jgi:hypothetical protein
MRRSPCSDLAAEADLAVDHRAAQAAFGVVVGRLDALVVGEGVRADTRSPNPTQLSTLVGGAASFVSGAEVSSGLDERRLAPHWG